MKWLLLFVGLVGAATYMFAPPRTALEDQSVAAQANPHVSGPLLTSWGSTLQSLRQEPEAPPAISQEMASARQNAAYGSRPHKEQVDLRQVVGTYKLTTSVHRGSAPPPDASVTPAAMVQASVSSPKPSQAAKPSARTVAASRPQKSGLAAKPLFRVTGDVQVADPHWRGGGDGRRGHGLFGFFRGRKTERSAWSIGPGG